MKINKDKLTIDFLLPAVLMITMVIVVFTQIIFRLMRNPLSWPDELSRWLLIWITFAGTSYCFKNGGLISVDFFVNKYFKESKRYFDIMSSVITCVFFILLMFSGVAYSLKSMSSHQLGSVIRIPLIFSNVAIIIGCVFSVNYSSKSIIKLIKTKRHSKGEKK